MWRLLTFLLCGIVGAVIATNKGRSGVGWFLLCGLLGPIGVVLALVVSRDQKTVEAQAIEGDTLWKA